jgi:DNA-binding MarR family transcriptional regulator
MFPMLDVACHCTQARRVARILTEAYDQALAPSGLKVTQFSVMRMVGRLDPPTISALAEATGLDRSTLGRNLKVMQKDGWIALGPGTDERTRVVSLTKAGRLALDVALPLWLAQQSETEARLPPHVLNALSEASRRLSG